MYKIFKYSKSHTETLQKVKTRKMDRPKNDPLDFHLRIEVLHCLPTQVMVSEKIIWIHPNHNKATNDFYQTIIGQDHVQVNWV